MQGDNENFFFFSSRRRHTRSKRDWSSDVCSSDLLGLTGLKCFPQLVSVMSGSERIERYQQQILAILTPSETEAFRQAVTVAERDGTFFIAQAYHCAVG